MRIIGTLLLFLSLGCAEKQSHHDALKIICESPNHVSETEPAQRIKLIYDRIGEKVRHPGAKSLVDAMGGMDPDQIAEELQAEASRLGIENCRLAAEYRHR